jgi:DNA-binding PadR family transcriptional regulator
MRGGVGYLLGTFDDVPLVSANEAKILELLRRDGAKIGLEIAMEAGIKRGSIYVTLSRMRQKAYVTSRQRLYSITEHGRDVLAVYEDMVAVAMTRLA